MESIFSLFINNLYITIIVIIYFCLYIFILSYFRNKRGNKRIFTSIINIQKNTLDAKDFIKKASIVFEKFIQKNAFAKKEYTSLQDVIENIIYYSETRNVKLLKNEYGIDISNDEKEKIYSFLDVIKSDYPYDILGQYDKQIILNLVKSINNDDKQSTENFINQIIKELFNKSKKINEQTKFNTVTVIISVVGIILTIFFGIQSIVKWWYVA